MAWTRLAKLGALAFAGLISVTHSSRADIPPGLAAELTCKVDGAAVVCFAKATPTPQSHITYSRVDLVKSPSFLKVVLGTSDYSNSRDSQPKLRLAFVGERSGSGAVVARVTAMVCSLDGSGKCPQVERLVAANVTVTR